MWNIFALIAVAMAAFGATTAFGVWVTPRGVERQAETQVVICAA